jgi:hypothetical protein
LLGKCCTTWATPPAQIWAFLFILWCTVCVPESEIHCPSWLHPRLCLQPCPTSQALFPVVFASPPVSAGPGLSSSGNVLSPLLWQHSLILQTSLSVTSSGRPSMFPISREHHAYQAPVPTPGPSLYQLHSSSPQMSFMCIYWTGFKDDLRQHTHCRLEE